jgi:hypothetical protein
MLLLLLPPLLRMVPATEHSLRSERTRQVHSNDYPLETQTDHTHT